MGDNANSTIEVTDEGLENAVASDLKTNTATVDLKTNKSSDKADTSKSSKKSKKLAKKSAGNSTKTQKEREEDIAETGTDLDNRPVY